jgi:hypothetical protein
MKADELRENAVCRVCGKKFGESGLPLFWRVTVQRFVVDMAAVQRQSGLEMMLGNVALASVMGPNEDLAKPIIDPVTVTVCENCANSPETCIAVLAEEAVA